jgi:Membrane transport protein
MLQSKIVFLKITVMFLVMVVGWWSARRQHLSPTLTKAMSVLVVQLTFPALVFVQMLETVSISSLQRGWWIPVFAGLSIVLAAWAVRRKPENLRLPGRASELGFPAITDCGGPVWRRGGALRSALQSGRPDYPVDLLHPPAESGGS